MLPLLSKILQIFCCFINCFTDRPLQLSLHISLPPSSSASIGSFSFHTLTRSRSSSSAFHLISSIMQRTLSSAVRSSLSSSPYSRSAGKSLQQLRYAHKELRFGVEGRAQLLKGVETLSKAVATTLGPKGRNVLIESSYGSPKITKGTCR